MYTLLIVLGAYLLVGVMLRRLLLHFGGPNFTYHGRFSRYVPAYVIDIVLLPTFFVLLIFAVFVHWFMILRGGFEELDDHDDPPSKKQDDQKGADR